MEDKKTVLFDCGKELFAVKGFKDTGVADITKMAGMSIGTFYNYYSSKDKLFMDIFKEENKKMTKGIMSLVNLNDDPVKLIKNLLVLNMEGMRSNPILSQWYNRDVYNKIEQLYREENGLQAVDFLYRDFINLVQKWQSDGKMRCDINSEMIMTIFSAIVRIGYYKEEIGLQYFPELQDYLTEFVLKGLTDFSK
jgi:AcrR family transcriptional regulator